MNFNVFLNAESSNINYADASPLKKRNVVRIDRRSVSSAYLNYTYMYAKGGKENSGGKDPIWRPRSNPFEKKRNKCHLVFSFFFPPPREKKVLIK